MWRLRIPQFFQRGSGALTSSKLYHRIVMIGSGIRGICEFKNSHGGLPTTPETTTLGKKCCCTSTPSSIRTRRPESVQIWKPGELSRPYCVLKGGTMWRLGAPHFFQRGRGSYQKLPRQLCWEKGAAAPPPLLLLGPEGLKPYKSENLALPFFLTERALHYTVAASMPMT